jgi:hypothetical protein
MRAAHFPLPCDAVEEGPKNRNENDKYSEQTLETAQAASGIIGREGEG